MHFIVNVTYCIHVCIVFVAMDVNPFDQCQYIASNDVPTTSNIFKLAITYWGKMEVEGLIVTKPKTLVNILCKSMLIS